MENKNTLLNKLFTQYVFQDLINHHRNSIYGTIVQEHIPDPETKHNHELISDIYTLMSNSYRNEYFYLNTLLNKLLLQKHSVNTTTALTQIPIGKSKADFILINGKAVVYEIKSDLDSFSRLETQVKDYYRAFDHVCVVTSEKHFNRLSTMFANTSVGIYVLTNQNRLSTKMKKTPTENKAFLEHQAIFKVLHKKEHENIIKQYYGCLPNTSPVFYYDECLARFAEIPISEAYSMALKELKNRNQVIQEQFHEVPYELKSLMYFSSPSLEDYAGLNKFLDERYTR